MSNSIYRPEIDGLRAVAVLSVVAFHYEPQWLSGGFLGVDIFFVISGYLITRNIRDEIVAGRFTLTDFYMRRVRRILPALLVTIAGSLIAFSFVASPAELAKFAASAPAAILSFSNVYFFQTSGYFNSDALSQPLLHTWSLGVEEQFYLVWPLILLAIAGRRSLLLASIVGLAVLSLVAAQVLVSTQPSAVFYLAPFRVFEFAVGAVLLTLPQSPRWALAEAGFITGLAAIAYSVVFIPSYTPMPSVISLLPCVGAALTIYCGSAICAATLRNRVAVWFGRISYSLYLVHWPVIVLARYVLGREFRPTEAAAAVAISVLLAYLLYRFIETPFRRRQEIGFAMPGRVLLASTVATALFLIGASFSASATGWAWRANDPGHLLSKIADPKRFHMTYYGGIGCSNGGCQSSPKAKRRIYVLGDSFAQAYYAGLTEQFPDINFVFFVANGCNFYSEKYAAYTPEGASACQSARERGFAEIRAHPADVIVTHDWGIYSAREQFGNGERFRVKGGLNKFAVFVANQLDQLSELTGSKHRLIVVGGVPRFRSSGSPFDCVTRPVEFQVCATTAMSDPTVVANLRINREFAAKKHNFEFLDPYAYLCANGQCRNFDDDGNPIYSDSGHLSIWGSRYLAQRMFTGLTSPLVAIRSLPAE